MREEVKEVIETEKEEERTNRGKKKEEKKLCKNGILAEILLKGKEGAKMDKAVKTNGIKYVRYEVYRCMVTTSGLRWVLEAPKATIL